MMNNNEYFYCYSMKLFKHLRFDKGISYICCGLNEKTLMKFWQFKRTDELTEVVNEFTERHNEA